MKKIKQLFSAPIPKMGHPQWRESQGEVRDVHCLAGERQPGREDLRESRGLSRWVVTGHQMRHIWGGADGQWHGGMALWCRDVTERWCLSQGMTKHCWSSLTTLLIAHLSSSTFRVMLKIQWYRQIFEQENCTDILVGPVKEILSPAAFLFSFPEH